MHIDDVHFTPNFLKKTTPTFHETPQPIVDKHDKNTMDSMCSLL